MDGRSTLNRVPLWIVVWWRTSLCINLFDIIVLFSVVNNNSGPSDFHLDALGDPLLWMGIPIATSNARQYACYPPEHEITEVIPERWIVAICDTRNERLFLLIVFHLPRMNRSRSSERSSSTTTTSHVKILGVSTDWMQMNVVGFLHHSNFLT